MKQRRKGGRGEERNPDGLVTLMCKGRLYTYVFHRTALVFFPFFFFFSFNNGDVECILVRRGE